MPILTLPLLSDGAIVDLLIGVSRAKAVALAADKQPIPIPVQIRALIDTGCSGTCVEGEVLRSLGLIPINKTQVLTATTGQTPEIVDLYDASLAILHPQLNMIFAPTPIMECKPLGRSYRCLLGRDLLAHCILSYNGTATTFTLAF
jgi:hypothetical protein